MPVSKLFRLICHHSIQFWSLKAHFSSGFWITKCILLSSSWSIMLGYWQHHRDSHLKAMISNYLLYLSCWIPVQVYNILFQLGYVCNVSAKLQKVQHAAVLWVKFELNLKLLTTFYCRLTSICCQFWIIYVIFHTCRFSVMGSRPHKMCNWLFNSFSCPLHCFASCHFVPFCPHIKTSTSFLQVHSCISGCWVQIT